MVTQTTLTAEGSGGHLEQAPASVSQPQKLPHLEGMMTLLEEIDRISEKTGEDRSGDWSGASGGTAVAQTGSKATAQSPRDQAIANLPLPPLMMRQLEAHVLQEVKELRKEIKRVTRLRDPGGAFRLNELYTRLRRLHALLHEIFEASYEVLRRLFIKVFIDKQPIL